MDLMEALKSGRFPWLLREHPELATAHIEGTSALMLSRYLRLPEATAALIAVGVPVGPLEAAVLGEVELLKDADVHARGVDGFTPLHLASYMGGTEAVRVLLEAGAPVDADAVNRMKARPIHSAVAVGNHASARLLLEAGANPNLQQEGGYTAMHSAAHNNDAEMIKLLLEFEADPQIRDDEGHTPRDMTSDEAIRALFNP
ncbi:ankyrin repeat domain-containing protein [Solirubrobacter phytolaccae]|uniref:Ankyrin repeat domain-containing protein n=1 Tax=Solirubrobacter phytolaccae TaxID=1404360 RepID=A0A9X3NAN3_9ACTN|nr:ankyrin repeat domain-containing protein [Solirubrobacter phytolaccae]MDA0181440.1 ankyrin repeat domain-containing protein [Solirubrobacter phytolaccae]